MRAIWTEQRKLEIWLEIELLAAEALRDRGVIAPEDFDQMRRNAAFDPERCAELEKSLNHDVVAFTTNVSETIGEPANRWLHFGLTSSDILDTATAVRLVESVDIVLKDLDTLRDVIAKRAREHRMTPMIGRSHGIHAEPTTFGLKMALMYDEFGRAKARLERVREEVAVGKLSGAVGTSAHLDPSIEAFVCERLGLKPTPLATQVIQRDIHAELINAIALIGCSIDRWATEFRHLQRTEVLEVEERFTKGQKGSSAMPHKRNPITGERLSGLARVVRGHAVAAMEDVALWHERDISHSSVERIIFPDSLILIDYMLYKLTDLTDGLVVYPENMRRNMELSLGLWRSQTVLLALVKKGWTRERAYAVTQRVAMATWQAKHEGRSDADFVAQLRAEPELVGVFDADEFEGISGFDTHFAHVDQRFREVGID